jgi:hypothetical protein
MDLLAISGNPWRSKWGKLSQALLFLLMANCEPKERLSEEMVFFRVISGFPHTGVPHLG